MTIVRTEVAEEEKGKETDPQYCAEKDYVGSSLCWPGPFEVSCQDGSHEVTDGEAEEDANRDQILPPGLGVVDRLDQSEDGGIHGVEDGVDKEHREAQLPRLLGNHKMSEVVLYRLCRTFPLIYHLDLILNVQMMLVEGMSVDVNKGSKSAKQINRRTQEVPSHIAVSF